MSNPTCTRCGTALSPDAAGGLCPRCLMAMNFESRTMPDGEGVSPLPPLTPEELADRFPQYDILECLGRGGMGVVYKARQKTLDRVVAIKLLAGEWRDDPGFAARFEKEAKTLARMSHPNIVTVHDFGEAGGLFHIVMEFIDGVNLRDLMRDGKMDPEQALAIVPPICEALEYAHEKGVVHRDIKPENILLDKTGRVKIADFGIASLVGAGGEKSGTPPYMAPEQETGTADRRADIYALGVVLYEMLTGERPARDFVAPSRKVQVDAKIDEMVMRALEKEPELRYQTAGEFRTVVETVRPSSTMASTAPAMTAKPPGMFRRWWWVLLLMIPGGIVLGLMGGAVVSYVTPRKYEAHAVVEVRPSAETFTQSGPGFFGAVYSAFTSDAKLGDVSQRLDLPQRWALGEPDVLTTLRSLVEVQNLVGTDLVEIRVRHTSSQDAMAIANALAAPPVFGLPLETVVHETATQPKAPVSPNVPLLLGIGAGAGLVTSPFLALLIMLALHRLFPWRPDRASDKKQLPGGSSANSGFTGSAKKSGRTGFWALALLAVAILAALNGVGREFVTPLALLLAFAFGLMGWRRTAGKVATIVSGALLILVGVYAVGHFLLKIHPTTRVAETRSADPVTEGQAAGSAEHTSEVVIEDLALHMIVAIREKDDAKLKSLAADQIKGWPEALPVFAVELRERMRHITGDERFDLRAGESLVDGHLAAVRCTGPAVLEGKCLVMLFVRTPDGWKNQLVHNGTEDMPLTGFLAELRKQLERSTEN